MSWPWEIYNFVSTIFSFEKDFSQVQLVTGMVTKNFKAMKTLSIYYNKWPILFVFHI